MVYDCGMRHPTVSTALPPMVRLLLVVLRCLGGSVSGMYHS